MMPMTCYKFFNSPKEFANLQPKYNEWAKRRSIYISTAMNMKNLSELINELKFN